MQPGSTGIAVATWYGSQKALIVRGLVSLAPYIATDAPSTGTDIMAKGIPGT